MNLIIKNGTVVTSKEAKKADIYIENEKIAAVVSDFGENIPESFREDRNTKIIDASGKLVMPGGIDVHTHLDMPFMGTTSTDDFETGTIAAAFGGTTSIIDYVIPQKNQSLKDALNIWKEKARYKAVIDYSFHMAIVPPIDKILEELPEIAKMGIKSIKCFLAYKDSLMVSDEDLIRLMQAAKESEILVCIHAEAGEIIDSLTKKYLDKGKTDPVYHALSRPAELEAQSVLKVLKLANEIDYPVYFVHLSTKDALEAIIKARKNNQKVWAETCPQYLFLDHENYLKPDFEGAKYVMSPPLRTKEHNEYLLNSLSHIDVIATDHCPFNFNKEKLFGKNDFTRIPNGAPGIETRMPLMFHEMINNKKLPLSEFVRLNCTQPAEIFGLKNKGDISIGCDADIVIWNPDILWTIKSGCLHENVDYTPFEDYEIKGKPETVLLRGKVIINNGNLLVNSGYGQFQLRS